MEAIDLLGLFGFLWGAASGIAAGIAIGNKSARIPAGLLAFLGFASFAIAFLSNMG